MKKARKKARKYEICCDNFSNYTEKEYIDAYLGPIIYGAPVVENDSTPDREYQDTAEAEGYSINFCPFCGKIIKVMVLSCNCSLCTGKMICAFSCFGNFDTPLCRYGTGTCSKFIDCKMHKVAVDEDKWWIKSHLGVNYEA
jgi:hypothetical protein